MILNNHLRGIKRWGVEPRSSFGIHLRFTHNPLAAIPSRLSFHPFTRRRLRFIRRHIWVSCSKDLLLDARRDIEQIGASSVLKIGETAMPTVK
jgi:hypothetical protein